MDDAFPGLVIKISPSNKARKLLAREQTSGADTGYTRPAVDDSVVYYDVVGDCLKVRVYDLRSLGRKTIIYVDPGASTSQVPQMVL
ncbi:hypothetical protein Scep_028304 [Stephania cephalantha]|uniref:Uncharacterized protein n=1 Tax=Stephania cephalantha TaxID=152367 RepID=A0AAP0EEB2_9MAGN